MLYFFTHYLLHSFFNSLKRDIRRTRKTIFQGVEEFRIPIHTLKHWPNLMDGKIGPGSYSMDSYWSTKKSPNNKHASFGHSTTVTVPRPAQINRTSSILYDTTIQERILKGLTDVNIEQEGEKFDTIEEGKGSKVDLDKYLIKLPEAIGGELRKKRQAHKKGLSPKRERQGEKILQIHAEGKGTSVKISKSQTKNNCSSPIKSSHSMIHIMVDEEKLDAKNKTKMENTTDSTRDVITDEKEEKKTIKEDSFVALEKEGNRELLVDIHPQQKDTNTASQKNQSKMEEEKDTLYSTDEEYGNAEASNDEFCDKYDEYSFNEDITEEKSTLQYYEDDFDG